MGSRFSMKAHTPYSDELRGGSRGRSLPCCKLRRSRSRFSSRRRSSNSRSSSRSSLRCFMRSSSRASRSDSCTPLSTTIGCSARTVVTSCRLRFSASQPKKRAEQMNIHNPLRKNVPKTHGRETPATPTIVVITSAPPNPSAVEINPPPIRPATVLISASLQESAALPQASPYSKGANSRLRHNCSSLMSSTGSLCRSNSE